MKRVEFLRLMAATAGLGTLGRLAAGEAAAAKRPNILFCIADDLSWPHTGADGCRWVKTPAFDRVAREGIRFTHAYTPNAKCAPSRACILTGRNSWQLKEAANHNCHFPAEFKTYAEALAAHGYHTGHTGKGWAPGDPGKVEGKPRQLAGRPWSKRTAPPPTTGISPVDYAANFADFLDARPAGQPFCFWYGALEPHRGYEFRSGIEKGGKRTADVDRVPAAWPDNDTVRADLLDYAFETEHFDRHLGRMLEELEARGELDNTLVVVTADNGMPFPRAKGQGYELSNHLPLAVMWRGAIARPGRVVEDFASFIDLAPTFLEAAGVAPEQSGMAPITGRSLLELFRAEKGGRTRPARDHVLIGKERHDVGRPGDAGYPIRGIVTGEWLYLRNFETERWPAGNPETGYLNCDGGPTKTEIILARRDPAAKKLWDLSFGKRAGEELYRLADDPDCLKNRAADPACADIKARLAAQMLAELQAQGDPRLRGEGSLFDEYPYVDPKTSHFYERYMGGEPVKAGWVNESDFDPLK